MFLAGRGLGDRLGDEASEEYLLRGESTLRLDGGECLTLLGDLSGVKLRSSGECLRLGDLVVDLDRPLTERATE